MTSPLSRIRRDWLRPARGRRLLLVGAQGFVGAHTAAAALDAGAEVVAACVGDEWRLAPLRANRLELVRVRPQWWELEPAVWRRIADGADAVVLLAYAMPPDGADPITHERAVNRDGAIRIAGAALEMGCHVVFTSSADVYGWRRPGDLDEDSPPMPERPYAVAKLEAENAIEALASPGQAVSLRLSTVFGPGASGPRAIPSFARAISDGRSAVLHREGRDVRDYVHVSDVAAAIVNAAVGEAPPLVNVGSGVGRSTLAVYRAVEHALGASLAPTLEPAVDAPGRLVLDVGRARRVLDLEPLPSFDEAVAEEAEWAVRRMRAPSA